MNKHNAKDYLPIVQAMAEGKTIQVLDIKGDWVDAPELTFSYSPNNYRIKPIKIEKTQEMWVQQVFPEHDAMYLVAVAAENDFDEWEKQGWKRRIVTISYEE